MNDFSNLIGKTREEAADILRPAGMTVRVMWRDGKPMIGTMDLRTDRVNVSVVDGKIDGVTGVG